MVLLEGAGWRRRRRCRTGQTRVGRSRRPDRVLQRRGNKEVAAFASGLVRLAGRLVVVLAGRSASNGDT